MADLPVLLLVGGGHAHLGVLESLRSTRWPPVRTILLSPAPTHTYSGMTPGLLQHQYTVDELTIDLEVLCRQAGVELVTGSAASIDPVGRTVLSSAGPVPFTAASLDVGSVPEGIDLPGVRENAYTLRPMQRVVELGRRLDDLAGRAGGRPVRVGVVGGGAGGVEIALAAAARIEGLGAQPQVVLIERENAVLADYPRAARDKIEKILTIRGVEMVTNASVRRVREDGVTLAEGELIPLDIVIWLSGAAPPPLLEASTLPLSRDGYFAVDAHLRSVDGSAVWGAGDCIALEGESLPKAGVYAVRQAPILAANLRAHLGSGSPVEYHAQSSFLSLLNTGDGRALLRWRRLVLHSRAAWWLKDGIDRRFVDRYRRG